MLLPIREIYPVPRITPHKITILPKELYKNFINITKNTNYRNKYPRTLRTTINRIANNKTTLPLINKIYQRLLLLLIVGFCISSIYSIQTATAQDFPLQKCQTVRIADTGRRELAVFNATLTLFAKILKFEPRIVFISPKRLTSRLKEHRVDVFLGHWQKAQNPDISELVKKQEIIIMPKPLLKDAHYGLATPSYMFEKGLTSISNIPDFEQQLNHKLFSIKENNNGNKTIKYLISVNEKFKNFKLELIETNQHSSFISNMTKDKKPFVIMSWEPNFNNQLFKLNFLDQTKISSQILKDKKLKIFPSDSMYAITHRLFAQRCSQINLLISQLSFSKKMAQSIMKKFIVDKIPLENAIIAWLKNNSRFVANTMVNVSDIEGKNGFKAAMNFIHRP